LMWEHFAGLIRKTGVSSVTSRSLPPPFVSEVCAHIERFSHKGVPELLEFIRKAGWQGEWGSEALMPLDFTPDNLFVRENRLSFIDPWKQGTYLGNPAVSIGQCATLMQLYHMREAVNMADMLKINCMERIPKLLGCDTTATECAFNLGATLQLVLSSYVRRESHPFLAAKFMGCARAFWS
ncbi:MAG: hypothetical protein AAB579_03225, partial [Patescibacteria group bacterium]